MKTWPLLTLCALVPFSVSAADAFPLTVSPAIPGTSFAQTIDRSVDDDCQPDLFDPATTPFRKEQAGMSPFDRYIVGSQTYPTMMIDGWQKEGEQKVVLKKPFDLTFYHFGCASRSSFVIELKKHGKRFALFTHVDEDWSVSPDQQRLAMRSAIRQSDGSWKKVLRIVTIATKASVRLPMEACTTHIVRWSQGKLITSSNAEAPMGSESWNYAGPLSASLCVWSPRGTRLAKVQVEGVNAGVNSERPIERFGILPREKNALYALLAQGATPHPSSVCRLAVIDTQKPSRTVFTTIPVHANTYFCAQGLDDIELDLSQFTFAKPSVRFRLWKGDEQRPDVRVPQQWQIVP